MINILFKNSVNTNYSRLGKLGFCYCLANRLITERSNNAIWLETQLD